MKSSGKCSQLLTLPWGCEENGRYIQYYDFLRVWRGLPKGGVSVFLESKYLG
jgi:hypothetical protein